uniref:Ecp2 effector protein-like domain-containing protein n=1 Tax=Colletotrichum fructicola (strain Nara gc5) TaxID=1213859 RepID=L2FWG1_COLFN
MIPKDTSAYIMNDRIPIDTNLGALANVTASNSTLANSNIPRKVDCERLAKFVQNNSARVKFKDRDVGYWAKFAAHGTCGIMFKTTKPGIVVTNRDMLRFVDNVIRWEECNTDDGGVTGKMGVWCILDGSRPIHNGETFKTPDYSNIKLVEANATEPKAPTDDPAHVTWVDVAVLDKNGNNATFQVNGNVRSEVKTLGGKSEQVITPLGPSKRCNGKTIWMGGAHKDSALIEDCKTLMIYIREHRKFWMFNADEVRAARDGDLTPIIKYQTCHFAYGPRYFSVIGNMDIERLLEGAIEHLDNTHGRMRGWGNIGCDLEEQFGNKAHGAWQIYP